MMSGYLSAYMKKVTYCIFVVMCIAMLSGCGKKGNAEGSKVSDDGRSYGGVIKASMKEEVNTAFFDVTVEDAKKYSTFQFEDGLFQADEGMTYLVLTLTIKNTYGENLSMSVSDFTLDYEGNDSDKVLVGYGKSQVKQESFMDNVYTLNKGETITKSILYTVKDMEQYTLCYNEYYKDAFEGDRIEITVHP